MSTLGGGRDGLVIATSLATARSVSTVLVGFHHYSWNWMQKGSGYEFDGSLWEFCL